MGQRFDQIEKFGHGSRPAVADHQGCRIGAAARFMNEMHVNAVYRRFEMRKAVDPRLLCAPIETIHPMGAKLFHVIHIGAVSPAAVIGHLVPGVVGNPLPDVFKLVVGNVKLERSYMRVDFNMIFQKAGSLI